jgi:hypothetical protein
LLRGLGHTRLLGRRRPLLRGRGGRRPLLGRRSPLLRGRGGRRPLLRGRGGRWDPLLRRRGRRRGGPANPAEEPTWLAGPLVRDSARWSPEAESRRPPIRERPPPSPARLPGALAPFPEPVVPPRPWRDPSIELARWDAGTQPSRPSWDPCGLSAAPMPWPATAMPRRDRRFRRGTPSGRGACSRPDRERRCGARRERRP